MPEVSSISKISGSFVYHYRSLIITLSQIIDSAPEGEKQKIIDENPEIMQIWDDETGDRMTSLCIIGRHMDKDALIASLDACLTNWHRA